MIYLEVFLPCDIKGPNTQTLLFLFFLSFFWKKLLAPRGEHFSVDTNWFRTKTISFPEKEKPFISSCVVEDKCWQIWTFAACIKRKRKITELNCFHKNQGNLLSWSDLRRRYQKHFWLCFLDRKSPLFFCLSFRAKPVNIPRGPLFASKEKITKIAEKEEGKNVGNCQLCFVAKKLSLPPRWWQNLI